MEKNENLFSVRDTSFTITRLDSPASFGIEWGLIKSSDLVENVEWELVD